MSIACWEDIVEMAQRSENKHVMFVAFPVNGTYCDHAIVLFQHNGSDIHDITITIVQWYITCWMSLQANAMFCRPRLRAWI